MIFVALFKQIPDIGFIKIDPATKRLVREGVPNIINPFDLHAVEAALEMRDRFGGSVYAITMGPPAFKQSAEVILSMGVDEVIHLSDRAFAGSDTLATSRALALAIKSSPTRSWGLCLPGSIRWMGRPDKLGLRWPSCWASPTCLGWSLWRRTRLGQPQYGRWRTPWSGWRSTCPPSSR